MVLSGNIWYCLAESIRVAGWDVSLRMEQPFEGEEVVIYGGECFYRWVGTR